MLIYHKALKVGRLAYFSELISQNNHSPKILFKVINSVIWSPPAQSLMLSCLTNFLPICT